MKYLKEFLNKHYKIQPLGKLSYDEYQDISSGGIVGVEIKIDDFYPGIIVSYADYAIWLEQELEKLQCQIKSFIK